jgi:hypothetical protein
VLYHLISHFSRVKAFLKAAIAFLLSGAVSAMTTVTYFSFAFIFPELNNIVTIFTLKNLMHGLSRGMKKLTNNNMILIILILQVTTINPKILIY